MSKYQSPFSSRYGSEYLQHLWSEESKRLIWRSIWCGLAESQHRAGLVTESQTKELREQAANVDLSLSLEKEKETKHDLMAELLVFADQCPKAAAILHAGATSSDIVDNADSFRVFKSLEYLYQQMVALILVLSDKVEAYANIPTIAYTHLQPAEPTTVGYRLAQTLQDLMQDLADLKHVMGSFKVKGFRGAVGTAASYIDLVGVDQIKKERAQEEERVRGSIPKEFTVTTQVYPRKQDYRVINVLAGIAQTLYKFAFDFRILSSPTFGDYQEYFGSHQVGSSAMPFKRNPIACENINSLSRLLAGMPRTAWDNAAHSLLERTLDDSANRRVLLPESLLITDEIITKATNVLSTFIFSEAAVKRQIELWGPFARVERVLLAATKKGGDRQKLHEVLKYCSMVAWERISQGGSNNIQDLIIPNPEIASWLSASEIHHLFTDDDYTGNASELCLELVKQAQDMVNT